MTQRTGRFLRLGVLAIFFCVFLFLTLSAPNIFVSPDENANAFFASRWASQGVLSGEEPLNERLQGLLHPRSILASGTLLLPGSFLGFPLLAGTFGALLGSWAIPFFTPIVAVLGLLAFWSCIFTFSKKSSFADAATFLFLTHPAFWYYASRPFMHNVAFLSFFLFACWFAFVAPRLFPSSKKRLLSFFLSGAFFALTLWIRTSEVLWLAPLVILFFAVFAREHRWADRGAWVLGFFLLLFPFAAWNQLLYGSFLETGYTVGAAAPDASPIARAVTSVSRGSWATILFPFGLHMLRAGKRALSYGVLLYPWTIILPLLGFFGSLTAHMIAGWRRLFQPKILLVFLGSLLLCAYLALLYGSWVITDNPNPDAVTIGNSYVRYWLPIFLAASLWGGVAVSWIWERYGSRFSIRFGIFLSAIFLVFVNGYVVFGGEDGLWATRTHLFSFEQKKEFILAHTEPNAIVIVDRADKFVFPDRRVVVPLRSEKTYAALSDLVGSAPVYYFGIPFPEKDSAFLQEKRLDPQGLSLTLIGFSEDEALYQIQKK